MAENSVPANPEMRTKKCVVKMVGRRVLLAANSPVSSNIRIISLSLPVKGHHKILHRIIHPERAPISFIRALIERPRRVLTLPGTRKSNLLLLMSLLGFYSPENMALAASTLSHDQRVLCNILQYATDEWNALLKYDPMTFAKLERFLKIDASTRVELDPQILLLLEIYSSQTRRHVRRHDNAARQAQQAEADSGLVDRVWQLHEEFCMKTEHETALTSFMEEYNKMVQNVDRGIAGNELAEERAFYNEIQVYNEFIITGGDPKFFNRNLLRQDWSTENEKKIVNFVRKNLKK